MTHDDLSAWCALWRAEGVGVKTYFSLLKHFETPAHFLLASASEIRKRLPHVAESQWRKWQVPLESASADLLWLNQADNHFILPFSDERYPPLLKNIPDPPPVLFVKGDWRNLWLPSLAMVGSRNASRQALQTAEEYAEFLALNGLVIVSGLALGVDGASHRGALKANGLTVGVVATGLDRVYPPDHHRLAHEIVASGALVSEFPIGTSALASNFLRRNRIISGLSSGVLVVEASERSGALTTARHASTQGREVFALPSSIHNPMGQGTNQLIKQGAKLVSRVDDIWQEIMPLVRQSANRAEKLFQQREKSASNETHQPKNETTPKALPSDEDALLALIGYEWSSYDELLAVSGLSSEALSAQLSLLELSGQIRQENGLFQRL